MKSSLQLIKDILQGQIINGDAEFSGVGTDTRTLAANNLFVALKGPQFDGHDFIEDAINKGAVAAIVEHPVNINFPQLVVKNTLQALGQLSAYYRQQFKFPIIAITGSYGKTTLKEMIAAILKQRGTVYASAGNFNNEIGLPLSLLQLENTYDFAVFELGANHVGEINYLAKLVQADISVITVANAAHLQGFGSLENIAKAKGELFENLKPQGIAIINADDPFSNYWQTIVKQHKGQILLFSTENNKADITARLLHVDEQGQALAVFNTPIGECEIRLGLPGVHQLQNAAAAIAATLAVGCDLKHISVGLMQMRPVKGRLVPKEGFEGARILDDTYNASPQAAKAALTLLTQLPAKKRIAVLGDMLELGDTAKSYHEQIGELAKEKRIDYLFAFGELSLHTARAFGENAKHFMDQNDLVNDLKPLLDAQTIVLVKGSRGMRMEKIVEKLCAYKNL